MEGSTDHPNQGRVERSAFQLDELWRRSGGRIASDATAVEDYLTAQLQDVGSYQDFIDTRVRLELDDFVSPSERDALEALPASVQILGDRIPLRYEIEDARGVAVLSLREKQARRLRKSMLPELDRPLRFAVRRGRREVIRVGDLASLKAALERLPQREGRRGRRRRY
jgi:hypothetical protein